MTRALVAGGVDDNYVYPYLVSIISAQQKCSTKIDFLLAYDSKYLSSESRNLIREVATHFDLSLSFIEIELPKFLLSNGHISQMAFARLMIADVIEEEFVWLDADTLCIGSFDKLLSSNFIKSGEGIAARKDSNPKKKRTKNLARKAAGNSYFNSGVLKISPEYWREQNYPFKWKEAAKNYSKFNFEWSDQCVLNYLTKGQYQELPSQYNVLTSSDAIRENSSILHFAGAGKPWDIPFLPIEIGQQTLSSANLLYLTSELRIGDALASNTKLKKDFYRLRNKKNVQNNDLMNSNIQTSGYIRFSARSIKAVTLKVKHSVSKVVRPIVVRSDFANLERRREFLSFDLAKKLNFTVKYGPFKGLELVDNLNWSNSDLAPMLLGTYEQPILDWIEKYSGNFTNFINLGAGDGYYVAGMLKASLTKRAYAYEITDIGRDRIAANTRLNGIQDAVVVRNIATEDFVNDFSDDELADSLILVDIEGAEFELLNAKVIARLAKSQMIIELHEFVSYGELKVSKLLSELNITHKLSIISTGSRNLDDIQELNGINDSDRWLLVSEGRPMIMKWVCCIPRSQ